MAGTFTPIYLCQELVPIHECCDMYRARLARPRGGRTNGGFTHATKPFLEEIGGNDTRRENLYPVRRCETAIWPSCGCPSLEKGNVGSGLVGR